MNIIQLKKSFSKYRKGYVVRTEFLDYLGFLYTNGGIIWYEAGNNTMCASDYYKIIKELNEQKDKLFESEKDTKNEEWFKKELIINTDMDKIECWKKTIGIHLMMGGHMGILYSEDCEVRPLKEFNHPIYESYGNKTLYKGGIPLSFLEKFMSSFEESEDPENKSVKTIKIHKGYYFDNKRSDDCNCDCNIVDHKPF